ncbi:diguanylate cyclase with PAS/PAC sensor [Clostridium carboxidivorans P7]|uniref:Diguanylate cyclase with PAS/PAC sensor n=2 Tax=Clostridium TaxID=1485 RepID=C6PY66_9CLOT|nr:histidine kinase N-terminal 7TM domain-containing protein [Clostridium carboxidivorans]EET85798.1 diguanylate cyclase with PAS/PAC sensor [Clostridium carboxidivorans P7]
MKINNLLSFMLLVSALVLFFVGYFAWKSDKKYVAISLIPVSIYASGYAFEILCTSIEWVKFWVKVEYLGGAFLGALWLMFALNFTGFIDKIKKRTLMLLYVIPTIVLLVNYTNDFHHLFYKKMYINDQGIFPILEVIHGPWYWVHTVYNYVLMVIGLIIFIRAYLKAVTIIKKQILLLIVAWIIPWISDFIYIFGLLRLDVDLAPLALCISALMYSFAVLRFRFLKLTPIALEKVFSNMLDGVIILDSQNNIVNFNNASKNIISELKYVEAGNKKIDEVLKDHRTLLKAVNDGSSNESLITAKDKDRLIYYKININNIYENTGEIIGKILVFMDVTEQNRNIERINKLLKLKEVMLDIGYSINEISDINDLLQLILDKVINCIDGKRNGSIVLLDKDENLKIVAARGYNSEDIKKFVVNFKERFEWSDSEKSTNKAIIYNDVDKMKNVVMLDTAEGKKIKSVIRAPIIIDNELYGFLNIDSTYNNIFDEGYLELMEYMASQISIAVTKHKLYEKTVYLSRYDKLTNVYNRSYFEQLLYDNIYNDNINKKEFF